MIIISVACVCGEGGGGKLLATRKVQLVVCVCIIW